MRCRNVHKPRPLNTLYLDSGELEFLDSGGYASKPCSWKPWTRAAGTLESSDCRGWVGAWRLRLRGGNFDFDYRWLPLCYVEFRFWVSADVIIGDQGCFVAKQNRLPDISSLTYFLDVSPDNCTAYCRNVSFAVAGVQVIIHKNVIKCPKLMKNDVLILMLLNCKLYFAPF